MAELSLYTQITLIYSQVIIRCYPHYLILLGVYYHSTANSTICADRWRLFQFPWSSPEFKSSVLTRTCWTHRYTTTTKTTIQRLVKSSANNGLKAPVLIIYCANSLNFFTHFHTSTTEDASVCIIFQEGIVPLHRFVQSSSLKSTRGQFKVMRNILQTTLTRLVTCRTIKRMVRQ